MDSSGPAFPQQMVETDQGRFSVANLGCGGMSLRTWLIGQALGHPFTHVVGCGDCSHVEEIASRAIWLAEAVLAHAEGRDT